MNAIYSCKLLLKIFCFVNFFVVCYFLAINSAFANQDVGKKMAPIHYLLMTDVAAGELIEHQYTKNTGPDKNPLKGWNSAWWHEGREETSVGFQYIPWRLFEPANGVFDKSAVEEIINRPGSKGRHIILRINCDWAGLHDVTAPYVTWQGRSADCPEWMYNEVGVAHITGMDRGVLDYNKENTILPRVTDFNSSAYLVQAEQVIAKLAEFYDGDPRIYAIQLGILGYWGEWHAHGSNLDPDEGYEIDMYSNAYIISDESKQTVYDAYREEFSSVRLMARYPDESILENVNDIGFHNDFFMPERNENTDFENDVIAREGWKQGPIGGEAPPEFGEVNREDGYIDPDQTIVLTTSRGMEMIEAAHYTTMLIDHTPEDDDLFEGYMTLHRKMGYNYQIESALFAESLNQGQVLDIALAINNIGVAPFYYDWRVEYALLDSNNQPVVTAEASDYNLRNMMPESVTSINGQIATVNTAKGDYRVGIRIIQPGSQNDKVEQWKLLARNTYIVFSNDIPVVEGGWNNNNALIGGWSILGPVTIK